MAKPIILIPARMASKRLPGKPLAEIGGEPMILHCARCAQAAELAPVRIATADAIIAEHVARAGFQAILTDPELPSGSDRCVAALAQIEADAKAQPYDIIINLQGDMPNISPQAIRLC